jgi:HEAT repeat protein
MQATKKDNREERITQPARVSELTTKLGSPNGVDRQHAREALVALGAPAVGPLIAVLGADRDILRWEAAKALTELRAPAAAPALVKTLTDENGDIRWLAAEALIGLGEAALLPLFEALMVRAESVELREAAHHVLRSLNHGELEEIIDPVLETLEHCESELSVPLSAEHALGKLNERGA